MRCIQGRKFEGGCGGGRWEARLSPALGEPRTFPHLRLLVCKVWVRAPTPQGCCEVSMQLCLPNTSGTGWLAPGIRQTRASSRSRRRPRKGSPEPPLGSPGIMPHCASLVLGLGWVCKLGPHVCPMKTNFQMSTMGLTSAAVLYWFLLLVQPRPLGFGEWSLALRSRSLVCSI